MCIVRICNVVNELLLNQTAYLYQTVKHSLAYLIQHIWFYHPYRNTNVQTQFQINTWFLNDRFVLQITRINMTGFDLNIYK